MRKILTLTFVLLLWACSKSSTEEVLPTVEEKIAFSMGIREGINVTNFRVGDYIPIDLTKIMDNQANEGFTYILKVVGNDATKHQILGVDYALKVREKLGYRDVNRFEITDVSKLPSFAIVPKVSGTFQLNFQLQKYDTANKKNVGEPVNQQLVFNAVKINFHFPTEEVRSSNFFRHSIHKREFKFSIDDGNREYDSYLSNYASSKRYEYVTYYDGQEKRGEFSVEGKFDFRDYIETEKGPKPLNEMPQTVTIEIIQYLNSDVKNIIKYENVRLEY